MDVFGDKSIKQKILLKSLVVLTLLTLQNRGVFAQNIDLPKDDLLGKWIITNLEPNSYKLHDTIEFQPDKKFESSIVTNTTNTGKWTLRGTKIKLKSCLHSEDNPYKCRDFMWAWIISEFDSKSMTIRQVNNDNELIIRYEKIE